MDTAMSVASVSAASAASAASSAHQDALLVAPAPAERVVNEPGVEEPVARVLLDSPLPHLDRPFDYVVPAAWDAAAQVGTRVAVRWGGQEVFGWVWERGSTTTHPGRLTPIRRVVSDLVVVPERTRALATAIAERTAGSRADVLRLAVPSRHARTEKDERERAVGERPHHEVGCEGWNAYEGGAEFVRALEEGGAPRAVWQALPARDGLVEDWLTLVAGAAAYTLNQERSVLLIVATTAQAESVAGRLRDMLEGEPVAVLSAEHGPARRYRAFVGALLGHVRVVVGTRAAVWAPMQNLGLAVMWDDGDNRLDEPRAPYMHARTVLTVRCALEKAGLLLAGWSRSIEAHSLVEQGWAGEILASRSLVRQVVARVEVPGAPELEAEGASGRARIPSLAHRAIREGLGRGPVLVQVPRGGYAPVVACQRCRSVARCAHCHGPLGMKRSGAVQCRWCGRPAGAWQCGACGHDRVRMVSVGSARTGDELGRAFPGVPVVVSGAREDHGVVAQVDDSPRLVVATPGAEPQAEGGYAAVILLDGAALSARAELGAGTEALRRWSAAVALAGADARVILLGGPDPVVAQALVRWDHSGYARRELAEREELCLPPAWRCARLDGPPRGVEALVEEARGQGWDVLGPVVMNVPTVPGGGGRQASAHAASGQSTSSGAPSATGHGSAQGSGPGGAPVQVRALVRVPRAQGGSLAAWLRTRIRQRSARREDPIRVELDPTVLW